MKTLKKRVLGLSVLFSLIITLIGSNPMTIKAATTESPNEIINEVSLDELKVGVPVTTYLNQDTGAKIEIELVKKEKTPVFSTNGDSGWSGGTIPAYDNMTLMVRTEDTSKAIKELYYKVDVNGKTNTIKSAYSLAYTLFGFTMQSTSLNVTNPTATPYNNARVEFSYTAVLIEYGVVIGTNAGYLNFEINSSGHVRTTWSF